MLLEVNRSLRGQRSPRRHPPFGTNLVHRLRRLGMVHLIWRLRLVQVALPAYRQVYLDILLLVCWVKTVSRDIVWPGEWDPVSVRENQVIRNSRLFCEVFYSFDDCVGNGEFVEMAALD